MFLGIVKYTIVAPTMRPILLIRSKENDTVSFKVAATIGIVRGADNNGQGRNMAVSYPVHVKLLRPRRCIFLPSHVTGRD